MDLVNSVTQNSNNRNVTMENKGDGNGNGDDDPMKKSNVKASDNNGNGSGSLQLASLPTSPQMSAQPGVMVGQQPVAPRSQVPDYLKAIGMDPRKFWPKKYRFTREKSPGLHNPLSIAQRNFYESNGYIIIDECAPKKLLDSIRSQHRDAALVSEFLTDRLVARNERLLQYARCFCDERLMLMTHRMVDSFQTQEAAKDFIDNQQIQRQQLYRDWVYLPFRPIDKVCCAITAVEPVEHSILVVPGTHRVGQCTISSTLDNISAAYDSSQEKTAQLRELFESSPDKLSSLVDKSKRGFKYVNLKPGQTLFYHPGLVHGFSNDLVNFRKSQLAAFAYYAAADCEYIDLSKSSQSFGSNSTNVHLPIGLAHFQDKNPSDYTSWIGKPKLLRDTRASL